MQSLLKKFRQELHTDDSKNEDLDFLRSSDQASAVVHLRRYFPKRIIKKHLTFTLSMKKTSQEFVIE